MSVVSCQNAGTGGAVLVALMLALPHHPAAWWVAMLASGMAAGWTICDARESWRSCRQAGNSRQRSLFALDCARSGVAFLLALALLVFGLLGRRDPALHPAAILIGAAIAGVYVLLLLARVLLRRKLRRA